jgi:hypothetical protein
MTLCALRHVVRVYLIPPRAHESRHPVPTRAIRRTKAEPQPCAAAWLPGLDSNQRGQGSEPCWGRQRPTRNRVRKVRFERTGREV